MASGELYELKESRISPLILALRSSFSLSSRQPRGEILLNVETGTSCTIRRELRAETTKNYNRITFAANQAEKLWNFFFRQADKLQSFVPSPEA